MTKTLYMVKVKFKKIYTVFFSKSKQCLDFFRYKKNLTVAKYLSTISTHLGPRLSSMRMLCMDPPQDPRSEPPLGKKPPPPEPPRANALLRRRRRRRRISFRTSSTSRTSTFSDGGGEVYI